MAESASPLTESTENEEQIFDEEEEDDYVDQDDLNSDEKEKKEAEEIPSSCWDDQFERLQSFQNLTGHCRVPRLFAGDKANLGAFVHQQRIEYYRKYILRLPDNKSSSSSITAALTRERIERLNSIGFDWMIHRTTPAKRASTVQDDGTTTATLESPEVAAAAALAAEEENEKTAAWQEKFQLLHIFFKTNGHTRVPKSTVGDTQGLGLWVDMLRKQAKNLLCGERTSLTMEQIDKLNTLGFEWILNVARPIANETSWQRKFALLHDFQRTHGHCRVPPSYTVGSTRLGNWVASQRRFYKLNAEGTAKLAQHRIDKLNAIGFDWSLTQNSIPRSPTVANETSWQEKFTLLQAFQREYGHCRVPQHYEVDGVKLGLWVPSQRVVYKIKLEGKGGYPQERIDLLNSIGFEWKVKVRNSVADSWTQNFDLLCAFHREKGHCRVPKRFEFGSVKLGLWVREQRRYFKHLRDGTDGPAALTWERIAQLNKMGFVWSCRDKVPISSHDECFARVEERLKKRALDNANKKTNTKKPRTTKEYGAEQTSSRIATARETAAEVRRGQQSAMPTTPTRILLASNDSAQSVVAQEKISSSIVPKQPKADHILAAEKSQNGVENDKKEASTEQPSLGAEMDVAESEHSVKSVQKRDNPWDFKFSLLTTFRTQNGHCRVPPNYIVDSIQLGSWVKAQRKLKRDSCEVKNSAVVQKRIEQLDSIGFDWIVPVRGEKPEIWNKKFELLGAFHREHGHCRVPKRFVVGSVKLGLWVREMRRYNRNINEGRGGPTALSSHRVTQLNSIGFVWSCKGECPWDQKFALLQAFQREHGHCLVPDELVVNGTMLGRFVANQRTYYRAFLAGHRNVTTITQDRFDKLNSIGFDWQTEGHQQRDADITQNSKEVYDDEDDNKDEEMEDVGNDIITCEVEKLQNRKSKEEEKGKIEDGSFSKRNDGELPRNKGNVCQEGEASGDGCSRGADKSLSPEEPMLRVYAADNSKRKTEPPQDGTNDRSVPGDEETRDRTLSVLRSSPRKRMLPRSRGK